MPIKIPSPYSLIKVLVWTEQTISLSVAVPSELIRMVIIVEISKPIDIKIK